MSSRRLEDRVRELCAKAVTTPDSDYFFTVIEELRRAMREHTERVKKMIATYPVAPERRYSSGPETPQPLVPCSICAQPVTLEFDKVDENGKPVHESCYVARLTQNPSPGGTQMPSA